MAYLPSDWWAEAGPDGTIRLARRRSPTLPDTLSGLGHLAIQAASGGVGFALLWVAPFVFLPAIISDLAFFWPLLPIVAVGWGLAAYFAYALVFRVFGREEWLVGKDLLEVRRHLLGIAWTRRYIGASLRIVHSPERGMGAHESWTLLVWKKSGLWPCRSLLSTGGAWSEVPILGRYLAEQTGWPLSPT